MPERCEKCQGKGRVAQAGALGRRLVIKLCRSVLGLQFQVETPHFFSLDAPEGAICMLFLGEAVINHIDSGLSARAS
jgi:hypothetical protein